MLQIKKLCKEKDIALQDLADKIDLNRVTLSRIVNNSAETTTGVLRKIAKVLDVDVKDLFSGEKPEGFVTYKGNTYHITSIKDLQNLIDTSKEYDESE